jgi:hypothetical protein
MISPREVEGFSNEDPRLRFPTDSDNDAVGEIFREFVMQSGIRIEYRPPDSFSAFPPIPAFDDVTNFQMYYYGTNTDSNSLGNTVSPDHAKKIFVGGRSITARDMHETIQTAPKVLSLLDQEHGKVVILGSGFSALPVFVADMYARGQFTEVPVVVDLFDYRLAKGDFSGLKERFNDTGLRFPMGVELSRLSSIVGAMDLGRLEAVTYALGTGKPPSKLMDASLILNIYGPTEQTIHEQLSMLKIGGKLLSSSDLSKGNLGPDFRVVPIPKLNIQGNSSVTERVGRGAGN